MVPPVVLTEHAIALGTVWAVVLLAGFCMSTLLRVRLGVPGYVLLGIVYWAISLYVFRFNGGLNFALGLLLVLCLGREGWEALRWAETHLQAPGVYVQASYGAAGSLLPACAGVATSGWHLHHAAMDEWREIARRRRPTHQFWIRGIDPLPVLPGRLLFENSSVTILELRIPEALGGDADPN